MGCNICNSGKIGIKWTKDLNSDKRKIQEACIEFSMRPDEVIEHLKSHAILEEVEKSVTELINDPEFFYKELYSLFTAMKSWLEFTMEAERIDRSTIEVGLRLIREIRETLKLIAELQGKITKGSTYQNQYIQIQGDLNMLVGTVLNEVCNDCQKKILKVIDNTPRLGNGKK
jgi:hypothetical protein